MTSFKREKTHHYYLTRVSSNKKTGPIAVSVTSNSTCPKRCSLRSNGCYSEAGPMFLHWKKVSEGTRGSNLSDFCAKIRSLPKFSLWRHNAAGDLPGNGHLISEAAMDELVHANRGRHGFTYTHYDARLPANAKIIQNANQQGFTINLSAETLQEADEYVALGIAPVVVILPVDQEASLVTPAGNTVTVCPAVTGDSTCATCAVCAVADRKSIIGFPAHGTSKAKAQAIFFQPRA